MGLSNLDPSNHSIRSFQFKFCDYSNSDPPNLDLPSPIIQYTVIIHLLFKHQSNANSNIYYYILLKCQLSEIHYDICMYII